MGRTEQHQVHRCKPLCCPQSQRMTPAPLTEFSMDSVGQTCLLAGLPEEHLVIGIAYSETSERQWPDSTGSLTKSTQGSFGDQFSSQPLECKSGHLPLGFRLLSRNTISHCCSHHGQGEMLWSSWALWCQCVVGVLSWKVCPMLGASALNPCN